MQRISEGGLQEVEESAATIVKARASAPAIAGGQDDDDNDEEENTEEEYDTGTMVMSSGTMVMSSSNVGTMVLSDDYDDGTTKLAGGAGGDTPLFMQLLGKKGATSAPLTNLDDLVKGGNTDSLAEMIKDLETNKQKEIDQIKEKFLKKRKPILDALTEKKD